MSPSRPPPDDERPLLSFSSSISASSSPQRLSSSSDYGIGDPDKAMSGAEGHLPRLRFRAPGSSRKACMGEGSGGARGSWCGLWLRRRWICAVAAGLLAAIGLAVGLVVHFTRHIAQPAGIIHLGYASYQGVVVGDGPGVSQFLGMRYASPPLGDLRFRRPAEPQVVDGVQRANSLRPRCLSSDDGYPVAGQDEDCLFVNVWAPATATNASRLPVWLFIQGGGYSRNVDGDWSGQAIVETSDYNVVVVTFNYRVGIFGFLAGQDVRRDGDLNAGLLDQRFLLGWAQRHIEKFGGDPDHVVIHGISAGAGSVAMHLAAYGGRDDGLFVGAMADSVFFPPQPPVSELEWQFARALQDTGCDGPGAESPMACLRSLDTATLQRVGNVMHQFPGRGGIAMFYWTPCVDGDILRRLPYLMYRRGEFVPVPILFGTVSDEGTAFAADVASKDETRAFLLDNYYTLDNDTVDSILSHYSFLPALPLHNAWFPTLAQAYGDAAFVCPDHMILEAVSSKANASTSPTPTHGHGASPGSSPPRAWAYSYNVVDESSTDTGLGVHHGSQGPASFGPGCISAPAGYLERNAAAVALSMRYWASFVRSLDPNTHALEGAPEWEPWQPQRRAMLLIQRDDTRMEVLGADEWERCGAWAAAAELARI